VARQIPITAFQEQAAPAAYNREVQEGYTDSVQARFQLCWLLATAAAVSANAKGQSSARASGDRNSPSSLAKIEDDVLQRLSAIQKTSPRHKASHFTHSKSARQIAFSLSAKNDSYL
jgi:hypothetical protein